MRAVRKIKQVDSRRLPKLDANGNAIVEGAPYLWSPWGQRVVPARMPGKRGLWITPHGAGAGIPVQVTGRLAGKLSPILVKAATP